VDRFDKVTAHTEGDLMKIDIHTHIMPRKYLDAVYKYLTEDDRHRYETVRTLWDIDERLRVMDQYYSLMQVLTPNVPLLELIAPPAEVGPLARLCNDEMAQLVAKYPDRFVAAIACLPINDIDAALEEAHRAITELGFKGIFLQTPLFDGPRTTKPLDLPELMPLYEMMSRFDLPILIHPFRYPFVPDYTTEDTSKYAIYHIFGWVYETTVAMARFVFSGTLERYPNLKIITHHCGAMVPYFAERIAGLCDFYESTLKHKLSNLEKPPIEYFRMFYNDTAVYGNMPALMCAQAFFGTERLVFATDLPYGLEEGSKFTRDTIDAIEKMSISDLDKEKIFAQNAKAILRLR
jgi:aminocarboxymuconate-semialdehyde decarboxylase